MNPHAPSRARGVAYAVASNLCFSTGGWFVRSLESPPDGAEIVFWRSASMTATLAVILLATYGRHAPAAVARIGWWGVASAAFLTATFFGYLVGTAWTTVANVNVTIYDVLKAEEAIRSARVLLSQLEVPLVAVEEALDIARANNVRTILDPAPPRVRRW